MKDKRAIIIKNPKLQKIRDNLRDILIQEFHVQWKRLFNERTNISRYNDEKPKSVRDMISDEKKRFRALQEQETELSFSFDKSILVCVSCGKGHRNMVYNKAYDAWYCTECYGMEIAYAKKLHQKRATSESHEDKAIKNHSKTFL
ncbi:MAG: hypothetical protein ACFFBH_12945 [Promethearchaeota archaeon]